MCTKPAIETNTTLQKMASTIDLYDFLNEELRTYPFEEEWTIQALRASVAKKEGYENLNDIKIFQGPFRLKDDELVKDVVGKEEGTFLQFGDFACFSSNVEILVWRGRNKIGIHRWFQMPKGEVILDLGEKRHFMNKGLAKFAIVRNLK